MHHCSVLLHPRRLASCSPVESNYAKSDRLVARYPQRSERWKKAWHQFRFDVWVSCESGSRPLFRCATGVEGEAGQEHCSRNVWYQDFSAMIVRWRVRTIAYRRRVGSVEGFGSSCLWESGGKMHRQSPNASQGGVRWDARSSHVHTPREVWPPAAGLNGEEGAPGIALCQQAPLRQTYTTAMLWSMPRRSHGPWPALFPPSWGLRKLIRCHVEVA